MSETGVSTIKGLHHFAHRCRDAEQTRLGLPLHHYIESDHVPSTGEYCPYAHIFFRMNDGSSLAFFDLGDNEVSQPSPNTPAWVNHLALAVDCVSDLERIKEKLQAEGAEVIGPIDHRIFQSIYFFDPNGVRLELTAQIVSLGGAPLGASAARQKLEDWGRRKSSGLRTLARQGST